MNDAERKALSLALHTAADLLSSAATLVELGEDDDGQRHLDVVRQALNAAAGKSGEAQARAIDDALAPTLAPAQAGAARLFAQWQQATAPDAQARAKVKTVN